MSSIFGLSVLVAHAVAYPWVVHAPGVDSSILPSPHTAVLARDSLNCPFNANHEPGFSSSDEYPYLGAKDGKPGTGKGGIQVPAPGDTAHAYKDPNSQTDIRGPCPALNALANHGFIARDGITTYNELMDATQNVYNVGFDLATILAVAGVGQGGDLLETKKLSIGCDASSRTAGVIGGLIGDELGLNGHNHFESDSSLTRNDYYLADEDNYTWNATLFTKMMAACDGNCDRSTLSTYRKQRWEESQRDNAQFFFGPAQLALYAAATFIYELFGYNGSADEAIVMSFFGAAKTASGEYIWNGGERIPDGWTNRPAPFGELQLLPEFLAMYLENPVQFGANLGPGNFNGLNFSSYIKDGKLNEDNIKGVGCALYLGLGLVPSASGELLNLPVKLSNALTGQLAPFLQNLGCPNNFNEGGEPDSGGLLGGVGL